MQLVMPPSPLVALEAVVRMAVYSARAMLWPRCLGNDGGEHPLTFPTGQCSIRID